ncbi:rhomboid family protein [Metabacillus arenae]|uniref:Rhomboid family intramembrane serine protease n=1 Tax=Metabacillus arenae TaxID=2771434 RepID=A0A926NDK5_9BACI|nr:rhomboid family intramembrane serine protease [Metabacillus arenae]MBD1378885.1 rhomboid family intramembrane serine protease [Metabacillus arenae]
MLLKQEYFFWELIRELIIKHDYQLINLSNDHQEVWLEPVKVKEFQLIRLKRLDIDWSHSLRQDAQSAGQEFEKIRKQTGRRDLNILNVYVTTYLPVDDWHEEFQRPITFNKTVLKTELIASEFQREKLEDLEEYLHVQLAHLLVDQGKDIDYSDIQGLKNEVEQHHSQRVNEERQVFEFGKPIFTYFFIGIQVIMFFLLELFGGSQNTETLVRFGAKYNPLILTGEWWRLITPIFLHIGMIHLFMNTLALLYIGSAVEKIYGSFRFLLIYFIAGIAGSLASFAFSQSVSAGASGAIFGCFGALLFLGIKKPKLFFRTMGSSIIIVIAINLSIGFIVPVVDNAGHIGGLIGGFAAAILVQLPNNSNVSGRLLGLLLTAALFGGLAYFGFSQHVSAYPAVALSRAQELVEQEQFEEAKELLLEASKNEQAPVQIVFLLSYTELQLGEINNAKKNLLTVVERDQTFHQAYFNLHLIYLRENKVDKAEEALDKALEIKPDDELYKSYKTALESA